MCPPAVVIGVAMAKSILITGGAGFIGSHLADHLLMQGCRVRALDNLDPQVHGPDADRPYYLDPDVELIEGDVRDPDAVRLALEGMDAVYHFASAVGVGQSMYQITRYTSVNSLGTAVLLEALAERPVERLVVASSMSIYGEGLYKSPNGELIGGTQRSVEQLKTGAWELRDEDGQPLTPVATPETKVPSIASIYALSKFDQERMCLMIGAAYGIPTVALRFFNVYGPRQALSNPYTGVIAIFGSRLLNGKPPILFEDGKQQRDFVSVYDVVRACWLALNSAGAPGKVINIGSGEPHSVASIAQAVAIAVGKTDIEPEITGQYRVGDIRHCFADISIAREVLGYEPAIPLALGIRDLGAWLVDQEAEDKVAGARAELATRGLVV